MRLSAGALGAVALGSGEALGGLSERPGWPADLWDPARPLLQPGKKLRVLPVLTYAVAQKREASSWKSWGGVQSEEAASKEAERISDELRALSRDAGFELEVLPVAKVRSPDEAAQALKSERDAVVVYAATGSGSLLQASVPGDGRAVIFVRHRSGPVSYWYEGLSTRYLASERAEGAGGPEPLLKGISVHDVVVDDRRELLRRLRAIHGVRSFLGSRVVALGGAGGKYSPEAPKIAAEKYGLEIVDAGYESFERRLQAALADGSRRERAEAWASRYLGLHGTRLETERGFVSNAFILYGLFKELLEENGASVFTIKDCMGTIMPMSRTTACLTLSLLNDEGLLAFCESDFVVIPAGILLRHLSGKPVFLHNSTFPHDGTVTCAHCTAPRRMDGGRYEPAAILTHYESEFGAAPKVEIPLGQEVTFVDPEFSTGRWLGFKGKVTGNPFYEICRSQQDVAIQGDWKKLLQEVRDSHWLMVYGDHLAEVGHAARKLGIRWEEI